MKPRGMEKNYSLDVIPRYDKPLGQITSIYFKFLISVSLDPSLRLDSTSWTRVESANTFPSI